MSDRLNFILHILQLSDFLLVFLSNGNVLYCLGAIFLTSLYPVFCPAQGRRSWARYCCLSFKDYLRKRIPTKRVTDPWLSSLLWHIFSLLSSSSKCSRPYSFIHLSVHFFLIRLPDHSIICLFVQLPFCSITCSFDYPFCMITFSFDYLFLW